ncbi:MAG: hypothetical protein ACXAC8_17425 [Candidatus Hodarchaeales archaeon]
MDPKITLPDSRQELTWVNKETSFLKDFIDYWKVIRDHRTKKIDEIIQICKILFDDYTKPFIEKWGNQIEAINADTHYLEDYYSFEFTFFNRSIMLIPHKILVFESLKPKEKVYHHLSKIKVFKEFLFYFGRTVGDLNLPLNKNDIQILRKSSSNRFTCVSEKIPSNEEMAMVCNCDPQTYRRRVKRLKDTYILNHCYLIDLAKIGYETYFSICENIEFPFNDFCRANIPFNVSFRENKSLINNKYRLVIFQIPFNKTEVYDSIKNLTNTIYWRKLSFSYIGNNLSSLTPSVESRWKIMPPILSIMDWNDEIVIANSDNGITYDLSPNSNPSTLSSSDVKVLSLFENYGKLKNVDIAKKTGLTEKYIREVWTRISDFDLVRRLPILTNIGLDVKLWISIFGNETKTQNVAIERVIEHLKCFPFTWLFYDHQDLNKRRNSLITGLIYIPSSWVNPFFVKFSKLSDYGFTTQLDMSYHNRDLKWNINLLKTYF